MLLLYLVDNDAVLTGDVVSRCYEIANEVGPSWFTERCLARPYPSVAIFDAIKALSRSARDIHTRTHASEKQLAAFLYRG